MYFYSKNGRRNIIHTAECFHISHTRAEDIGYFESVHEAFKCKFGFCKHCNPMGKLYKKEREKIARLSTRREISVYLGRKYVSLCSAVSEWRICLDCKGKLALYHKNSIGRDGDEESEMLGYHLQRDAKRKSISAYMYYIASHDEFRANNPLPAPKIKKPPARKGTKRYKQEAKKRARFERRRAIRNVLDLIESLQKSRTVSATV